MSDGNVFGSGDLSPELLRGATFVEQDGRIDAAEVRTFLDRVASALEVTQSGEPQDALRREFARNAEIAQQVLDAGQAAAQQLRGQANEAARQIVEQAEAEATVARGELQGELAQSRAQVSEMRTALIADLRDLYDRIGASLYRFERAVVDQDAAPINVPQSETRPEAPTFDEPDAQEQDVFEGSAQVEVEAASSPDVIADDAPLPPPAWTQLPAQAWGDADDAPSNDFHVTEDAPLAPGEPLVDLREFHAGPDEVVNDTPEIAPQALEQDAAPLDAGLGSWLDPSPDPAPPPTPDIRHDDALAQALIGGDVFPDSEPVATADPVVEPLAEPEPFAAPEPAAEAEPVAAPEAAPVPAPLPTPAITPLPVPVPVAAEAAVPPPAAAPASAGPAIDAAEVRQLILDSIAAGQSRESIGTYMREQMGLVNPDVLIDAALGTHG
ncbi:MAG: hypothetical protein JWO69_1282 [Thermoleophilia bacterium]|nr:hypothetical protein [Thermoleophilia bacterium]